MTTELTYSDKEIKRLTNRIKELEMIEKEYSDYLYGAWELIKIAGYKNHSMSLRKFMEGE